VSTIAAAFSVQDKMFYIFGDSKFGVRPLKTLHVCSSKCCQMLPNAFKSLKSKQLCGKGCGLSKILDSSILTTSASTRCGAWRGARRGAFQALI
jgi:hypothetical protein